MNSGYSFSEIALGSVSENLGLCERALIDFEQSLALARELKDRAGEGLMLQNMGGCSISLKHYGQARKYLEHALSIMREVKNRNGEGFTLGNLASLADEEGKYAEADVGREQALAIFREVLDREREAQTLGNLMSSWKDRQKLQLAIFYGKQAVNIFQELRGDTKELAKDIQHSYLQSHAFTYRNLADLLITEGRLPEAQQVLNLLKEEEYFEFVRRDAKTVKALDGKADFNSVEIDWAQRYREIGDHITALGKEHRTLSDKKPRIPEEDQRVAQLAADLIVAREAFQQFLTVLTKEADRAIENDAAVAVKELQGTKKLMSVLGKLGSGTVAVYTLVGEEKYRALVITPDTRVAREYAISRADLNRKVTAFREVLQHPTRDPVPLAQELYQILVGPIAQDLHGANADTVLWSLDGALRYLPMAALHNGRQYLVEQYRSVVFTPASPWDIQQQPSPKWRGLGLGVSKAREGFAALPAVPDELHGIIREGKNNRGGGVLPGVVLLDDAFTQQSMVAGLRQRYPVVHIASHFQVRPGNDAESYLLMGDGTQWSMAEMNTRYDTLFADVELLALSACDTAIGGADGDGKEVEGFGVLAQQQGAQAVLATLWPIADVGTKELMQQFYRIRESKKGMSKAEALRQAQLALLEGKITVSESEEQRGVVQVSHDSPSSDPQRVTAPQFVKDPAAPYAHPYYWAPFILIGNWR